MVRIVENQGTICSECMKDTFVEDMTFEVIKIGMKNRSFIGKKQGKGLRGRGEHEHESGWPATSGSKK